MKKIFYMMFISLMAVSFSACGSDDDDDPAVDDKVEIKATIKCKVDGSYVGDNGAALYLFKDFTDYVNYEYKNGTYVHKTSGAVVNHTQKATANADGVVTMKVNWGQYSLVVWESAKYPGKFGQNVYEIKKGENITISEIYFEP